MPRKKGKHVYIFIVINTPKHVENGKPNTAPAKTHRQLNLHHCRVKTEQIVLSAVVCAANTVCPLTRSVETVRAICNTYYSRESLQQPHVEAVFSLTLLSFFSFPLLGCVRQRCALSHSHALALLDVRTSIFAGMRQPSRKTSVVLLKSMQAPEYANFSHPFSIFSRRSQNARIYFRAQCAFAVPNAEQACCASFLSAWHRPLTFEPTPVNRAATLYIPTRTGACP